MKAIWFYQTPIGKIGIGETQGAISCILFEGQSPAAEYVRQETPLIRAAADQLAEYFDGKRTQFDLPLSAKGTAFQQSVWKALQTIPVGETRSYKAIAQQIGNPKAMRAVGMANHRNPIPIVIPCHRVVGADGSLTGFGGGLPVKEYLLNLEKNHA